MADDIVVLYKKKQWEEWVRPMEVTLARISEQLGWQLELHPAYDPTTTDTTGACISYKIHRVAPEDTRILVLQVGMGEFLGGKDPHHGFDEDTEVSIRHILKEFFESSSPSGICYRVG